LKIAILSGGKSEEKEISLISADSVKKSMDRLGYESEIIDIEDLSFIEKINNYDLFFNALHGNTGEDGKIQAFLEMTEKKYTSSPMETCVITFDKYNFYNIFKNKFKFPETIKTEKFIPAPFSYPLILKPRKSGSSKGVYIIHNENEYNLHLNELIEKYGDAVIQEYIKGTEISVSYLEKDKKFIRLPYLIIKPKKEFYDYQAKYTQGLTDFETVISFTEKIENQIQKIENSIFDSLIFKDIFRLDAIIKDDTVYVLEINIVPGLTPLSDLPQSAAAIKISFDQVIQSMINNNTGA